MIFTSDSKRVKFVLFCVPFLIFYALFFLMPTVMGVGYSFTDWNAIHPEYNWVGLENYLLAFRDQRFLSSFSFTLRYTLLYTLVANVLAILLAVVLSGYSRRNTFLRSIFFYPNVLNMATVGFMWQFLLGTLQIGLAKNLGWSIFNISWLSDPNVVLYTVTLVRIWVSVGYLMLIYIAGIQGIDAEVREAAIVDGATGFKLFWKITFPLITPALTSSIFISLINSLKVFPLIMTLTRGGPGYTSESVSLNIYREAFEAGRSGYASAKAVLFTLVILVITGVQLAFFSRREDEMV